MPNPFYPGQRDFIEKLNDLDAAAAAAVNAVRFDAQTLSDPQKTQARANLGFDAAVRATPLTGLPSSTAGAISATDTQLTAFSKTATHIAAMLTVAGSAMMGFVQAGAGAKEMKAEEVMRTAVWTNQFTGSDPTGTTNSTTAFTNANAAAQGKVLYIVPGTYKLKAMRFQGVAAVFAYGCTFIPADTDDMSSNNTVFDIASDGVKFFGGKIDAPVSKTFGTVPTPYYCARIFDLSGDLQPSKVHIRDLEIVGGRYGLFAYGSVDLLLENVRVKDQYEYGFSCEGPRGTSGLVVRNFRADGCGGEGFKMSSLHASSGVQGYADIDIDGLFIYDCGKLKATTADYQEGADFFFSAGQRLILKNFIVARCGNGGIEVKRADAPGVTPNELKNLVIGDGIVEVDLDSTVAIALNWSGTASVADTLKQVSISNVTAQYSGPANPTSAYVLSVQGYTDVDVNGLKAYGEFSHGIVPSAAGTSSDSTIRRLRISDSVIQGAKNGLSINTGVIDDVELTDNDFNTTHDSIVVASAVTGNGLRIMGGSYTTASGSGRYAFYCNAPITGVEIGGGASLVGDSYAAILYQGTGKIAGANLTSRTEDAVRVDGGDWEITQNQVSVPTAKRGYMTTGGVIKAAANSRGYSSSAPTLAGAFGDIVYANTPSSSGGIGWFATAAGNPATWTPLGSVNLASPGPIGSTTPSTAAFTTGTFSGQVSFAAGSAAAPSVKIGADQSGFYQSSTNKIDLTTAGVRLMSFGTVGAQGNYFDVSANNTGLVRMQGAQASIPLAISSKTAYVQICTGGSTADEQARFNNVTSAVARLQFAGAVTGSGPTIGVSSTDTNSPLTISAQGTSSVRFGSNIEPTGDNTISCGTASFRWSQIYAGTGTINTSDARLKTVVSTLSKKEIAAAETMKKEIGTYKYLESVDRKGELARRHIGLTVQRAIEIMQENGLDPMSYAFICHDTWPEVSENVCINPGAIEIVEEEIERAVEIDVAQAYIEFVDGQPVQKTRIAKIAKTEKIQVVDENGDPVFDENGHPLLIDTPVMEKVKVKTERAAAPIYKKVILREAGDSYGFRTDQLAMFLAAV